jgi:hypothetical protein
MPPTEVPLCRAQRHFTSSECNEMVNHLSQRSAGGSRPARSGTTRGEQRGVCNPG